MTFVDSKTNLNKLFSNSKEAVFYKNKKDLVNKIRYYLENDKLRKNVARNGRNKYHSKYNNKIISNYILAEVNLIDNINVSWPDK